jgi:hypothetical protein
MVPAILGDLEHLEYLVNLDCLEFLGNWIKHPENLGSLILFLDFLEDLEYLGNYLKDLGDLDFLEHSEHPVLPEYPVPPEFLGNC